MRANFLSCKGSLLLTAKSTDFINLVLMLWTVLPMKINKNNFFLHSWSSPYTLSSYSFQDHFVKMPQGHTKCNFVFLSVCPMKPDFVCVCALLTGMKYKGGFKQNVLKNHIFIGLKTLKKNQALLLFPLKFEAV